MLGGGYTLLTITMSDWFTVLFMVYTLTVIRIYKTEIKVYRKLKSLRQTKEVEDAVLQQHKRIRHAAIQGVLLLGLLVTAYRLL